MTRVATANVAQRINYLAFDKCRKASKLWLYIGGAGAVATGAGIIYAIAQASEPQYAGAANSTTRNLFMSLIMVGLTVVFGSVIIYAWKQSAYFKAAFLQFVADNGWQVLAKPSDDSVATSLLGAGHGQGFKEALAGTYSGLPFTAVVYHFTTGSGRSRTVHHFVNLHFQLKQAFPLIVLDNRQDRYFDFLSNLPSKISKGRELRLEGDFNERYKVTVLPGTERDVLHVMTPDFMAELLDHPSKTDIELVADKLFVIKHLDYDRMTKPILKEMFATTDVMIKNLGELADTWQASSSAETISNMAATALSARQNIRRRRKQISIVTVIMFIFYLLISFMSN